MKTTKSKKAHSYDKNMFYKDVAKYMKNPEFKEGVRKETMILRLADELSHQRRNMHLTQKQLADKVGMNQQEISRLESGSQNATLDTLMKVAEGLGKKLTFKLN